MFCGYFWFNVDYWFSFLLEIIFAVHVWNDWIVHKYDVLQVTTKYAWINPSNVQNKIRSINSVWTRIFTIVHTASINIQTRINPVSRLITTTQKRRRTNQSVVIISIKMHASSNLRLGLKRWNRKFKIPTDVPFTSFPKKKKRRNRYIRVKPKVNCLTTQSNILAGYYDGAI